MNNKDLAYFRTLIIQNYLSIIDKNSSFNGLDNLNGILQEASKGNNNTKREEKQYFVNREEEYMNHLIAALERIDKNRYGMCVSCGKEIPRERLEEVPHTRYCVPCKNNAE